VLLPLSRASRIHLTLALAVGLLVFGASLSAKPGDLVATPLFVDLGNVVVDQNIEVNFTLTNNSNHTIDVTSVNLVTINVSPRSLVATGPCTLDPGASCTLPAFMSPADVGTAIMRVRWRAGSVSSNWVIIAANGVTAAE
jgi:hypothetical protein